MASTFMRSVRIAILAACVALESGCPRRERIEEVEAEKLALAALGERCGELRLNCEDLRPIGRTYSAGDAMWAFQYAFGSDRSGVANVLVDGFRRTEVHLEAPAD